MNKTKLIDAYNKAREVFDSFDSWKGSGMQGPPGASDWGRPDLIKEGNELLKIMRGSLKKPKFTEKEFLSFSDRIARLVTNMAIKHANYYQHNGKDMYECRDLLKSILNIEMTSKTNSHLKKNLAKITRNVEINGGNVEEARFKSLQNSSGVGNNNSGCYIATMVYGDYEHPQVLVLREFRDNFLAQFLLGRLFIRFYYKFSPGWVKSLEHNKMINKSIKKALNAFIKIYKK